MDIKDITADTHINEVLNADGINQRAAMTRLAALTFGKAEGHVLRAYTQFNPRDLGALIEARRKGVFDYGETIQKVGVGAWVFPKDPGAVLHALDLAAEGKYDDVDLGALGLTDDNGKPIVEVERLFPTMKAAPKKPATAKPKTEPAPSPAEVAEVKEERKKVAPKKPDPEPEVVQEAPREVVAPKVAVDAESLQVALDRIDKLSSDLGEVLEGMHKQTTETIEGLQDELNQNSAQLSVVLETLEGVQRRQGQILSALATFDRNVRQITLYFVDPGMEFEELDLTTPEKEYLPDEDNAEEMPDDLLDDEPIEVASESTEPEVKEAPKKLEPSGEVTDRYTEDELRNMDLADLRAYAESIGVTPARFQNTNVNRILSEYERQDKEG